MCVAGRHSKGFSACENRWPTEFDTPRMAALSNIFASCPGPSSISGTSYSQRCWLPGLGTDRRRNMANNNQNRDNQGGRGGGQGSRGGRGGQESKGSQGGGQKQQSGNRSR